MAQLVISAAGAAVGSLFGVPQLGWAIGSAIGASLFPTKTEGPRLNDLRVTGTEYGQVIPWVAGSPRVAGQIIWASQKRETGTTQEQGKGGGPEYTTYTYDVDLLYLLSENEINGISRVWLNGDLVFDGTTTRSGVWSDIRVLTGSSDQLPDPTYEAVVGSANAPAYRTRGCVLIQGLQLGQSGQIPNLTFEVGTAFSRDYSVVKYLFQSDNVSPNDWTDSSAYKWTSPEPFGPTSGSIITGDGEIRIGEGDCIRLQTDSGRPGLEDYVGDYTLEADVYLEHPGGSNITRQYVLANLFGSLGVNFIVSITSPLVSGNGTYFATIPLGGSLSSIKFTTTCPVPYTNLVNSWLPLIFQKEGTDICLFLGDNLLHSATISSGEAATLLDISRAPTYIGNANTDVLNGKLRVKNFRFSTHAMYPSRSVENRILPLKNYIESIGSGAQGTESLTDTCRMLMSRAGYSETDYDVSELFNIEKPVRALALSQNSNTRTVLEMLQSAYFFEVAKSDKIYFRPRASTPVDTIDYDDLATRGDISEDVEPFALKFANDLETPAQVSVSFNNIQADYQIGTEYSDRLISGQESVSNVQIPMGFTSAEGKGIADAILLDQIASQNSATITLPLEYAYLEPSDVVTISTPDRSYRARLVTKKESNGILEFDLVLDDANALESAEITDSDYPTQATIQQIASTLWESLDIPLLRDVDNTPGFYVAVKPDTDGELWPGAGFFRSWDDVTYANLLTFTNRATFGTCTTTLGNWTGGNRFDETNTLTVNVGSGTLSSSTRSAMLNDLTINVMVVGSELIRFRTATLISTGVYTLSGLIRGFRGTEWAIGGHVASERCVLLDSAVLRSVSQTSELNILRYVKALTSGFTLGSATSEQFTDTGACLKPFSVANPRALASGSDVVVTWDRRTRLSYVYGGTSPTVPLGEAFERYRIRVYDGSNLVRTEEVSDAQTFTYTAAMISADGFASTNVATFEIVQLSEIIGEGYPAEVEGIIP